MLTSVSRLATVELQLRMCVRQFSSAKPVIPGNEPVKKKIPYLKLMIEPPRRFKSVFSMFIKQNSIQGFSMPYQLKRLSCLWASLSEEEKQPYRDAYFTYQKTFENQMESYRRNLTPEQRDIRAIYLMQRDQRIARSKTRLMERYVKMPKKRVANPFKLFVLDHYLDENGEKRSEEEYEKKLGAESIGRNLTGSAKLVYRCRELATKWRGLIAEEKNVYQRRFEKLSEENAQIYDDWLKNAPKDYVEAMKLLKIQTREGVIGKKKVKTTVELEKMFLR